MFLLPEWLKLQCIIWKQQNFFFPSFLNQNKQKDEVYLLEKAVRRCHCIQKEESMLQENLCRVPVHILYETTVKQ